MSDKENKILNKVNEFDKFVTRITNETTPEHQNIYEHWADFKYDIEHIIKEEK